MNDYEMVVYAENEHGIDVRYEPLYEDLELYTQEEQDLDTYLCNGVETYEDEQLTFPYSKVKDAFVKWYGQIFCHDEFDSFNEAFDNAWNSFDYVPNSQSCDDVASTMAGMWQFDNNEF